MHNSRVWQIVGVSVAAAAVGVLAFLSLQPERVVANPDYSPKPIETEAAAMIPPLVVYIGDSFVGGSEMGGNGEDNWTAVASAELGWQSCSMGVGGSGWTRGINDWTFGNRIDWALSRKPSMVVFANGVNDLNDGIGTLAADADADLTYFRSAAPEIPFLVVGQIRVRDEQSPYIERANADLRAVTEAHGGIFVDPTAEGWFDREARSWLGSDGFHPTDEGHVYLAGRFRDAVTAAGVSLEPVASDSRPWGCSAPKWQTTMPDGSTAPAPSPSP